jgi:hypothetical protein
MVRVASSFRRGRIFLAGDAAHTMPPWGGFGANTGIQDAHNLAWKLAEVIEGRAHETLLDTYDLERVPVGKTVAELAGAMSDARGGMRMASGASTFGLLWTMRKVFPWMTVGYGYASPAVVAEPGKRPGPGTRDLKGRPGTRVPHAWIDVDGARRSTLDLVGPGFTLLVGDDGAWREAALGVSSANGLALTVHRIEAPGVLGALGIRRRGAMLVRPDGFVAWRSKGGVDDARAVLAGVFSQVLARPCA